MHRIDTPTAQKDKFGAGKNGFTRGNPQTGTPATDLDDDYFDMLQEELAGVVEASGVNLEKSKHNQLLTAMKALLLSRAHPFADIKADGAAAIAEALSNLGLPTLGIAGTGDILTALDWQQFNFVPGARYFIKSSDMSNVPAQIVITQPTFNAVMDVIGYDGITRHVDIWFSSTPDEYFSRYQVMIAGYQGSRTFSVRRIWTSSEPVPLSGGGTGASTPAGARSNLELGGLSVEDIAPINKGGTGADNVSSALDNFGIGPIANASEVTAGTSKKLIDAVLLKAFLPKRSFQANDVIRIPDQPGGLMVQFGTLTGVSGSDVISSTLTFPELFPNACLAVIPVAVSSDTGGGMVGVQVKTPTRSNADIFIYERNGGAIAAHSVQYIAIGW